MLSCPQMLGDKISPILPMAHSVLQQHKIYALMYHSHGYKAHM
jgi:hypothetical protein